jgi:Tol biopolymer transport system component
MPLSEGWTPRGEPRLLVPEVVSTGTAWTGDGEEIVYSFGPPGRPNLYRVPVRGGAPPQPLAGMGEGLFSPAISRRSGPGAPSRLVFERRFRDTNISRVALPRPGAPAPFIASSFREVFPQYSPDGKSVVFYSNRTGSQEIWRCDENGADCRQVTTLGAPVSGSPRWSPDGDFIAFDSNRDGTFSVYVVSADGGPPRQLTRPPGNSFSPNWSLDGRSLYFATDRGGSTNVWVMPLEGGSARQVTRNGGSGPAVSPDGKYLYYVKEGSPGSLWRMPPEGGPETQVAAQLYRYSYAVTAQGVYFLSSRGREAQASIQFLSFASGQTSTLVQLDKPVDLGLTVSPDGRYLLYPQVDYAGSDLMLVENFQ